MSPAIVEDFSFSVLTDNKLVALSVAEGESIPISEMVELAAEVRALYDLATLFGCEFDLVADCHSLWLQMHTVFSELCAAWANVPQDGEVLGWYRCQLARFN